jgi:hypothetical protein
MPRPFSFAIYCATSLPMWSKIFFTVLAASTAAMAFSTYYAWSWLGSIGIPADAAAGYVYHLGVAWPMLWITTIGLLFLANAVLWTRNSAWALWTTFGYFAVFLLLRFLWLEQTYSTFIASKGLARATTGGVFMAVLMVLVIGAIVFFDQYLITRAKLKVDPSPMRTESTDSQADINHHKQDSEKD